MVNLDHMYNPEAAKLVFNRNYFVDKKLGFQVIEYGTILPHKKSFNGKVAKNGKDYGGIVDGNGEFINSSFLRYGWGGQAYTSPPESIQHSSETVVYFGMLNYTWGHLISDCISRVWFLKSDVFQSEFKDSPLVYTFWDRSSHEIPKNFRRLLEILEIDVDKLRPVLQPTQFEKIILPDVSFDSYFTSEYRETIDRVRDFALKNRKPSSSNKVYYFYDRRSLGEERLEEYFKSKGYVVVRPEELTLDEQLNLLINADSFAAPLGSISHNALFLRNDSETILIPRATKRFQIHQSIIDQVHPLNINYLDSILSIFDGTQYLDHSCYIISPQLKRFFGDKWDGYEEDDFKIFLQYVKDSLGRGSVIKPNAKEYYGSVLEDFIAQLKQREDLIAAYNMPQYWETFQPTLSYQTHVSVKGWGEWIKFNEISNPLDQQRNIQAIKINYPSHKIYYAVYYNDKEGWSEEVTNGEIAGTTGKSKSIYGIKIRFDEAGTKEFDMLYRIHKFDGEWTSWAKNGETLYSYGVKLNALQIKLETKRK